MNKGGSDSPFLRQQREWLVRRLRQQHLCKNQKENLTQIPCHLARTQLFTQIWSNCRKYHHCLVIARRRRRRWSSRIYVCVYACGELFGKLNYNDHWLTQQLQEGNSYQDNLLSKSEASYLN